MADKDKRAPETFNSEQDDEDAQAQTVAREAIDRATGGIGPEGDEKPKRAINSDDDTEDLVDHIRQMKKGGIDMSAYRGEPNMDDNESKYGRSNVMKDEPGNSDS